MREWNKGVPRLKPTENSSRDAVGIQRKDEVWSCGRMGDRRSRLRSYLEVEVTRFNGGLIGSGEDEMTLSKNESDILV